MSFRTEGNSALRTARLWWGKERLRILRYSPQTPIGGAINVHHHTLSANELLGQTVELLHVP